MKKSNPPSYLLLPMMDEGFEIRVMRVPARERERERRRRRRIHDEAWLFDCCD